MAVSLICGCVCCVVKMQLHMCMYTDGEVCQVVVKWFYSFPLQCLTDVLSGADNVKGTARAVAGVHRMWAANRSNICDDIIPCQQFTLQDITFPLDDIHLGQPTSCQLKDTRHINFTSLA